MAWSECANGRMGPVKDSYHRVSIAVTVTDIDLHPHGLVEKLLRLCVLGCDHLHLQVDLQLGQVSTSAALALYRDFSEELAGKWRMSIRAPIEERLFVTIICRQELDKDQMSILIPQSISSEEDAASNSLLIKSNVIIIDWEENVASTLTRVHQFAEAYAEFVKIGLCLPQQDDDLYKLQGLVNKLNPNYLQIFYFGSLVDPTLLQLRKLDYIHSRGFNAFINLPDNFLMDLSHPSSPLIRTHLTTLARKYNKFEIAILSKILLQIGYVVSLSIHGGTDEETIYERFLFQTHPFIYRREFVSPTNVYHFVISCDEVTLCSDLSEEIECKWDDAVLPLATARAAPIPRTNTIDFK